LEVYSYDLSVVDVYFIQKSPTKQMLRFIRYILDILRDNICECSYKIDRWYDENKHAHQDARPIESVVNIFIHQISLYKVTKYSKK